MSPTPCDRCGARPTRCSSYCEVCEAPCHDNVNTDFKSVKDSTLEVLWLLEEARGLLLELPSNRVQNYELHHMLDELRRYVRGVSESSCFAWQVPR